MLGVTHVETTVDGAVAVRRQVYRAPQRARSTSASSSRPAATSCASRPRSTGTRRHRMLRAEFRPGALRRVGALRDPVRAHRARHHRARPRREGPVRDLRAQVDRDGGCRWRVRAAQRRQVRSSGEERSAEPEPAALPDVPRQDRRSRHPPLHLRVLPVRDRRSRQGRARGLPAQQPAADHRRGAGRQLRGGRRRRRDHRDREAGRERRRRGAAALREPRDARRRRRSGSTCPHRTARETDLLERPSGTRDLGRLVFGPFEIKTILLED